MIHVSIWLLDTVTIVAVHLIMETLYRWVSMPDYLALVPEAILRLH